MFQKASFTSLGIWSQTGTPCIRNIQFYKCYWLIVLYKWFISISGPSMKIIGKKYAKILNFYQFAVSYGWGDGFFLINILFDFLQKVDNFIQFDGQKTGKIPSPRLHIWPFATRFIVFYSFWAAASSGCLSLTFNLLFLYQLIFVDMYKQPTAAGLFTLNCHLLHNYFGDDVKRLPKPMKQDILIIVQEVFKCWGSYSFLCRAFFALIYWLWLRKFEDECENTLGVFFPFHLFFSFFFIQHTPSSPTLPCVCRSRQLPEEGFVCSMNDESFVLLQYIYIRFFLVAAFFPRQTYASIIELFVLPSL